MKKLYKSVVSLLLCVMLIVPTISASALVKYQGYVFDKVKQLTSSESVTHTTGGKVRVEISPNEDGFYLLDITSSVQGQITVNYTSAKAPEFEEENNDDYDDYDDYGNYEDFYNYNDYGDCNEADTKIYEKHSVSQNTKTLSVAAYSYNGDTVVFEVDLPVANVTLKVSGHTHVMDAKNTNWVQVSYNAPTCKEKGVQNLKCKICGYLWSRELAKTSHKLNGGLLVEKSTVYPKVVDGYTYKVCTICGNRIKQAAIPKANTSITISDKVYTGSAIKPTLKVYTKQGNKALSSSDYSLSYGTNKNVGAGSVTVTFKGNYTGKITVYFNIIPKATSISSVTATSKGFKITYKKQATQTDGYYIQWSTKSDFSNPGHKYVKDRETLTKTITGLKAKTKYYVRVRTYRGVGNKNYFSKWSSTSTVTTKA